MLDELYSAWPLSQERIIAIQTRLDEVIRNERKKAGSEISQKNNPNDAQPKVS